MAVGILSQEGEDAGLPATSLRQIMGLDEGMLAEIRHGVEIEVEDSPVNSASPANRVCHEASRRETVWRVIREEYSDRKLFLGMALRPQNRARPSSATSAMMWLLRSMDQSLRASAARSAWAAGIMREPGSLAASASASVSIRTRSAINRNSPPTRVVNSRDESVKSPTLATASALGPTRPGRSSSSRRGKGANPSAARTSRTAVALSGVPCSLRA